MLNIFTKLRTLLIATTLCCTQSYAVAEEEYWAHNPLFMFEGNYPQIKVSSNCKFVSNLTEDQIIIMRKVHYSAKPYNLHLTAIAIAWKESKLGKYKVRMGKTQYDRSFGIMHTVSYWRTTGMSAFEKGLVVQKLILDDDFSILSGIEDLLYWQQRARWDWYKGVAMYNAGGNYKNGIDYADDVTRLVKELKQCGL